MAKLTSRRAKPRVRASRRDAGFTLIELMIALVIGGIAISAFYQLGAESSRIFHQQSQVASTQTALRSSINQLKHDIARAGYLSTPNVTIAAGYAPQTCGPTDPLIDAPASSGRLAAFSAFQDNVPIVAANNGIDPTGDNAALGFTADDIVLFGNYETAAEYPGVVRITPTLIGVDQNWHSFRRDFTNWYNAATPLYDPAAFANAFQVGRLVRIQTTRRARHFARVAALPALPTPTAPAQIQIDRAVPANCLNDVDGGWVAPVSAIRYYAANATAATEVDPRNAGPIAQLIRLEVRPDDKVTPLNNGTTPRVVLDYLVAFNLSFTMTDITGAGQRDNYVIGAGTSNVALVNGNPERIRSVRIDLAVRTPQPERNLAWSAVSCGNPMRCFKLGAVAAVTRVRTMHAEVFVPNVAYEGY